MCPNANVSKVNASAKYRKKYYFVHRLVNSFNNETSSFNTDHFCLFDISGNKTNGQNSLSSIQSFVDVIGGPGKVYQIKKVFGFDAVKALRKLLDYENKTMVHSKILNAYMYFIIGDFFEEWNEITLQTHIRKYEELTA